MPFYIRLDNATSYEKGQSRYAVAGANNEALIEQSAQKLRDAVKTGNVEQVASLIEFPISVLVKNKKKPLNNYTEFINNYSLIFTKPFREAIINSVPHNMFTNANGIMLGKYGELWFNAQGKVYVINNYISTTCTVTNNKIHRE